MLLHRPCHHGFVLLFSFTLNTTLPGYQQMVFSTCFFGFDSQKPGFDDHWIQSGVNIVAKQHPTLSIGFSLSCLKLLLTEAIRFYWGESNINPYSGTGFV